MKLYSMKDPSFWADITSPSRQGSRVIAHLADMESGSILMGEEGDDSAPVVTILEFKAGQVIPEHSHRCHRVEILLKGSLHTKDGRELSPGDLQISKPGEFYGPFDVGPQGATTIEIFSHAKTMLIEWADTDDPTVQATIALVREEQERQAALQRARP